MYASEAKKFGFLVHLDRFSRYLKYLRNFEEPEFFFKVSNTLQSLTGPVQG